MRNMKMMRIGIICPSEIALRRFMPALSQINRAEFVGLAICPDLDVPTERQKAQAFLDSCD